MFRRRRTGGTQGQLRVASGPSRPIAFVNDPANDRRRDLARRAAVAAMLAAFDDPDERDAYLAEIRCTARSA